MAYECIQGKAEISQDQTGRHEKVGLVLTQKQVTCGSFAPENPPRGEDKA